MPRSKPTRTAAYGLLLSLDGCEEILLFSSRAELALALAERLGGCDALAHGHVEEFLSNGGRRLTHLGYSREVTEMTAWGPVRTLHHRKTVFEAFGASGSAIDITTLLCEGRRLAEARRPQRGRRWWYATRYYCGYGPVPGVHKSRGGGGWHRRLATANEIRLNALVVREDGEPAARATRRSSNLPTARDDYARCGQRTWKSQHNGRKAWDC